MYRSAKIVLALLALAAPATAAQAAAEPVLVLELNRAEPLPAPAEGCRLWMLLGNDAPGAAAIAALRLDLVAFGLDGLIARRVAVELGPVGAGRTMVRLFDLPGLPCERMGRLLINDVLACRIGGQDATNCADRLRPANRTAVRFGL